MPSPSIELRHSVQRIVHKIPAYIELIDVVGTEHVCMGCGEGHIIIGHANNDWNVLEAFYLEHKDCTTYRGECHGNSIT